MAQTVQSQVKKNFYMSIFAVVIFAVSLLMLSSSITSTTMVTQALIAATGIIVSFVLFIMSLIKAIKSKEKVFADAKFHVEKKLLILTFILNFLYLLVPPAWIAFMVFVMNIDGVMGVV